MSQSSNAKNISLFILLLGIIVAVKLLWTIISWLYLPSTGITLEKGKAKSSLYYRYKFVSNSIAPPKIKQPIRQASPKAISMRDIRLVGLYSGKDQCIVTLIKRGKSYILSQGEEIDHFVLTGASAREAYFKRNNQTYSLTLFEEKGTKGTSRIETVSQKSRNSTQGDKEIIKHDGITEVPREILKNYVSNIDKAMKDIGLKPIKRGEQMIGYKVRFIRRGSPFSKLGIERGDVIKAINGEDIIDFSGPMNILKSVDTLEGLTITVMRNNEEKDLEYEVK